MPYSPPFASRFVTKELVEQAFDMVAPSMGWTLKRVAKRNAGHLRVSAYLPETRTVDAGWERMFTTDFGDSKEWEHDYEGHATSKEEISQRTGLSSREVQMLHPEMLEPGDTVYFGSATRSGIVVAYSGVEAFFDELFAKWLLDAIMALVEYEIKKQRDAGQENYLYVTPHVPDSKTPYCMQCGIQMQQADNMFACPNCGNTSEG